MEGPQTLTLQSDMEADNMFKQHNAGGDYTDLLISDFTDPAFQAAFRQYFAEMGIEVKDWDGLFQEMNRGEADGRNAAWVRRTADGGVVGFIQFIPIRFTSWFFEESCGFIREFWVAEAYRNRGHGSELLALAENDFLERGIYTCILTTDAAQRLYERHGYVRERGCRAKNEDDVFAKRLK